jgi:histidine triad (HIT) family protein
MSSPFTPILEGKDSELVVAENAHFVAILERKPMVLGHVVVISKDYEDNLFDLSTDALSSLMTFAKPISKSIQKVIPCRKVGVAVIGLETRHAHLHLVPLTTADDLNFTRAKISVTESELLVTAQKIRSALSKVKT